MHYDIRLLSGVANEPWVAGEDFAHVHTLLVNKEGVCLHRNVTFQLWLVVEQHLL